MDDVAPFQRWARRFEILVLCAAALSTLATLAWLLAFAGHGLEFSDEGFYLNWISRPELYAASHTQFGFIYQPLFRAAGGDVATLRRINMLLTTGSAFVPTYLVLRELRVGSIGERIVLSGLSATVSLALFQTWLPTPSYNGLVFQALAAAASGLVLCETDFSRKSVSGWLIVGVSGWLAFMAKPTSAAALAVVAVLYVAVSGKLNVRLALLSGALAAALVLVTAWAIDGSVLQFAERLRDGAALAGTLDAGHDLAAAFRWDGLVLDQNQETAVLVFSLLIAAAIVLCLAADVRLRALGLTIGLLMVASSVAIILGWYIPPIQSARFSALTLVAAPLGGLGGGLIASTILAWRMPGRAGWTLLVCLALLPHVYAFGTNNSYWGHGSMAALFWVLAALVFVVSGAPGLSWRAVFPIAAGAQLLTVVSLGNAIEHPYRQSEPLRLQKTPLALGPGGATLFVSEQAAGYVSRLREIAAGSGFRPGDPVIDLTGHYPMSAFALQALPIGQPWTVGGYPGSDEAERRALRLTSCDLIARAWLLTEPTGKRALSMAALGDLAAQYDEAGRVASPTGSYPQSYEQILLRPVHAAAAVAARCEQQRRAEEK